MGTINWRGVFPAVTTKFTAQDSLADVPAFEAIKESSADTRRFPGIRYHSGDLYTLFCGVDDIAFECFSMGAVGGEAAHVHKVYQEAMDKHPGL